MLVIDHFWRILNLLCTYDVMIRVHHVPKLATLLASVTLNSVCRWLILTKYCTLHYLSITYCHTYCGIRTLLCVFSVMSLWHQRHQSLFTLGLHCSIRCYWQVDEAAAYSPKTKRLFVYVFVRSGQSVINKSLSSNPSPASVTPPTAPHNFTKPPLVTVLANPPVVTPANLQSPSSVSHFTDSRSAFVGRAAGAESSTHNPAVCGPPLGRRVCSQFVTICHEVGPYGAESW